MKIEKKHIYIAAVCTAVFALLVCGAVYIQNLHSKLDTALRVVAAKEAGIQELNKKLGISNSDLVSQSELESKYRVELEGLQKSFKDLVSKHNLEIESRDNTIFALKGKVNGGKTNVVVEHPEVIPENTKIAYSWTDKNERFKLSDPDIFKQGDEQFSYKLKISVTGYVYTDESGDIKINKLVAKELGPDPSEVEIVDSKFEYVNLAKREKSLLDVFHPRLYASFDTQLYPGLGLELVNLGRYIDYLNLGLTAEVSIATLDGLKGISDSTVGVGVSYTLVPPFLNTNFGIGIGLSTPMNNFLGRYILSVDAIFYLTN